MRKSPGEGENRRWQQVFQITAEIPVLDPWGIRGVNLTLLWGGGVMKWAPSHFKRFTYFMCMNVLLTHACLVPSEVKRRHWNWSSGWLWAAGGYWKSARFQVLGKNKCCQSLSLTSSPNFQTLSGKTTMHDRLQSCLLMMPGAYSQVTSCIYFPCPKSNRGSHLSKHPDHYPRFWCRRTKGVWGEGEELDKHQRKM